MKVSTRKKIERKTAIVDALKSNERVQQTPTAIDGGFKWEYKQEFQSCPTCHSVELTMKTGLKTKRHCLKCGHEWFSDKRRTYTIMMPVRKVVYL